jgi:hypothetical protein
MVVRLLDTNLARRIFLAVGHLGVGVLGFFFCLKANFGTVSDLKFAAACFICSHLGLKSFFFVEATKPSLQIMHFTINQKSKFVCHTGHYKYLL